MSNTYAEAQVVHRSVCVLVDDTDLATLIKDCRKDNYELGEDIGVILYNNTPLKEIVEGGITVISTDLEEMGKLAALQIINRELQNIKVPFSMYSRKSF